MISKKEASETKQKIRERLFAAGKLPDASERCVKCSTCEGTGRYCREYTDDDGAVVAELMECAVCRAVLDRMAHFGKPDADKMID